VPTVTVLDMPVVARGSGRRLAAAARIWLVATVLLGLLYPAAVTLVARVPGLAANADGSLVTGGGRVVGSDLIGQSFADADGTPLPGWFQPRPSAGGWDGAASGATQLGPDNPDLVASITAARQAVAARLSTPGHPVTPAQVPADAVTASGSGLDPQISPAYAALQVRRVAADRGLDPAVVQGLVDRHTQRRAAGFVGEPRVDVLLLNRDLARF
jgi:K+-transporting ATPase ATPase C chain